MKRTRSILAVILVIAMLAGMGSALALEKYQYTKYRQYMCVGDSIAAGYTYSGSWDNYGFVRVPGAYHDIVANAVDADLLQYACSGFRLIEFRYMMDGVKTDPDDFWEKAFGKQYMSPKVLDDQYTDMFRNGIKTSDLMSINLGSNDILTPAVLKAISAMNASDDSAETSKMRQAVTDFLNKLGEHNSSFARLLTLANTASGMPPVLRDLVKNLWDYYQLFKQNWEASMKVVYELNPDITVLALSVYNPAFKIYVDANNSINLGPIVQPVIDLINQFLERGSKYANKYTFVDVDGVDSWGMTMQDPDYFTYFVWSMHPTRAGHTDIANRMLKVLPEHWVDIEFSEQPKDVTVAAGQEASFSVATKFGNTPYYQWYSAAPGSDDWTIIQSSASKLDNDGKAMTDADGKALTNETYNESAATATLKVTAEKAMDGTRYRCVVKDFYGQRAPITSDAATLKVTDPAPTPTPTAAPEVSPSPSPEASPEPSVEPTASPEPAKQFPFKDVSTNIWYYPHVYYVWDNGIMEGISADTFAPDMNTSRAQFAAVIYRMAGKPAVTDAQRAACPFKDLTADWYKDAVVWCFANGVVNGTGPDTFEPDSNITREQMVTMLYRYSKETVTDTAPAMRFTDSASISGFAVPAVAWAVQNGIVNVVGDGSFAPQGLSTRAQLAAVLSRYMQK